MIKVNKYLLERRDGYVKDFGDLSFDEVPIIHVPEIPELKVYTSGDILLESAKATAPKTRTFALEKVETTYYYKEI